MAAKKRTRGRPKNGSGPNKSDFVRQHPNLSAAEVVAKAKESGISISPVLVYKVRGRAKPGAAKTRRAWKSSKGGTASDFVRSMPVTTPAKDVIAAAKAKGIRMSANLVYMVRATDRKRGVGTVKRRATPRARARLGAILRNGATIVEFKKMAFALGIDNARRALDELERGLATLFGD